jgi:hypothetical protein
VFSFNITPAFSALHTSFNGSFPSFSLSSSEQNGSLSLSISLQSYHVGFWKFILCTTKKHLTCLGFWLVKNVFNLTFLTCFACQKSLNSDVSNSDSLEFFDISKLTRQNNFLNFF